MVTEHVLIKISPEHIDDFVAAMEEGQAILRDANNVRKVSLQRGVETDNLFLLLIDWEQLDDHTAFTKTPDFGRFGGLVGKYFQEKPAMSHFAEI